MINDIFDFCIHDLSITLDECFYELLAAYREKDFSLDLDKISKTFDKTRRLMRIYREMQAAKYKKIDWDKACEDGFLCLKDYYVFDFLEPLRKKGIEKYLEYGIQEVVDKLNKEYNLN